MPLRPVLLTLVAVLCAAVLAPASVARAATFTVNTTTSDEGDHDRTDGRCDADPDEGEDVCSLRAAIQEVNRGQGDDTIAFDLDGEPVIRPFEPLPPVVATVTIDGRSQPGFAGDPVVRIEGTNLPPAELPEVPEDEFEIGWPYLLELRGTNSVVDSVVLSDFNSALLGFWRAHGSSVVNSYIGTDETGTSGQSGAQVGVYVHDSAQVVVGGGSGDGNVIADSELNVIVSGAQARNVLVGGNRIGVQADGVGRVGDSDIGVLVTNDHALGAASHASVIGNVIAGHGVGIRVGKSPEALILGNWVGFDAAGLVEDGLGGWNGPRSGGIDVVDAPGAQIGGTDPGSYNAVAGARDGYGVRVRGTSAGTKVQGNRIGTDLTGTQGRDPGSAPTGNAWGVIVTKTPGDQHGPYDVTVGGDGAEGNVIDANTTGGVAVVGATVETKVLGNVIGGTIDGAMGAGNQVGVYLDANEDLGDDDVPVRAQVGAPGRGNELPVAETWAIVDQGSKDLVVQANRVGIDRSGEAWEVGGGIGTTGERATVGGRGADEGNVVAAAREDGILVAGAADGTKVVGNRVGTAADGTLPDDDYAIGGTGILVRESGEDDPVATRIGGSLPGEGNVVGAAGRAGIGVRDEATLTRIEGNLVGLEADGASAIGSEGIGIEVRAGQTIVGSPGSGNHVAGTEGAAIDVWFAEQVNVQGNALGLDLEGTKNLPVEGPGVLVHGGSKDVLVGFRPDEEIPAGCADACNRLGEVAGGGIVVEDDDTQHVAIRGNQMATDGLGLDLGADGPDELDQHDADDGPNGRLNAPTTVHGTTDPQTGTEVVTGTIVASRPELLKVDVYGHRLALPGQEPGGGTYLGTAVPDERGDFRLELDEGALTYTAIAVAHDGATSEPSAACRVAAGVGDVDVDGDGLCTEWETTGIDFDRDGLEDQRLADADPARRDLYLEVDAMDESFWQRELSPALRVLRSVRGVFANAPDGGIRLHFDDSPFYELDPDTPEDVPHHDRIAVGERLPGTEPNDLGDFRYGTTDDPCDGSFGRRIEREHEDCWAMLGARGAAYRYVLMADELAGSVAATESGKLLAVGLGGLTDERLMAMGGGESACITVSICRRDVEESVLVHELGHALGLEHGGDEQTPVARPNYLSVMNPAFATPSLYPDRPLDLSREHLPDLDETGLAEPAGLGGEHAERWDHTIVFAYDAEKQACSPRVVASEGPYDFNGDGDATDTGVAASLDDFDENTGGGPLNCQREGAAGTRLEGYDDWANLRMDPRVVGELDEPRELGGLDAVKLRTQADLDRDGVVDADDVCTRVPDAGQADEDGDGIGDACLPLIVERDLSVALDVTRGDGGITAKVTLRNDFPVEATGTRVNVTLPAGWTQTTAEASAGTWDAAAGTLVVPSLPGRAEVTLTLIGTLDAAAGDFVAELAAAGQPDPDSTPGGGDPREDDRAAVSFAPTPVVGVADASVVEGTRAGRKLSFAVALDRPASREVTVRARTASGTATAGADFAATETTVRFAPGTTQRTVAIPTIADRTIEQAEQLTLSLSEPSGADLGRASATGTIRDDDVTEEVGDLRALTCVSPALDEGPCAVELAQLSGADEVDLVGDRDVYVHDTERLVLLHRDPATEALSFRACWAIGRAGRERGCARLTKEHSQGGTTTISGGDLRQVRPSTDGRLLVLGVGHPFSGQDDAVVSLTRDPATGLLSLNGCVGEAVQPRGCLKRGIRPGYDLLVAPGGRHVYVLRDDAMTRIDLDTAGVPTGVDANVLGDALPEDRNGNDPTSRAAAMTGDGLTIVRRRDDALQLLTRDPQTGALTRAGTTDVAGRGGTVTIGPDDRTAYVTDPEAHTVRALTLPGLQQVGCVAAGDVPGCTKVPTLDGLGPVAPAPDSSAVYVPLASGGTVVLRRGAAGALTGGRCVDPEAGEDACEGAGAGDGPAEPGLALTADGAAAFTVDGAYLHHLLRIVPPANPDDNRAPVCADGRSLGQPGEVQQLHLDCVDPDGDPLTLRVVATPAHGTLGPLSTVTSYTPAAGFRGADALTFRASDGKAESRDVRVEITVANAVPTCDASSQAVRTGRRGQVLAQCRDADGDPVQIEVVEGPAAGTLGAFDRGFAEYAAPAGFEGEVGFRFRGFDGHDWSAVQTGRIVVANGPPQCSPVAPIGVTVRDDDKRTIACRDPEGDPVKLTLSGTTPLGTARLDGDVLTFASAKTGSDKLVVRAVDVDGKTAEVTVDVTVTAKGQPTCTKSCTPDAGGTVTITYKCNGRTVDAAKYATCQGTAVVVMCPKKGPCVTSKAAAAAGAKRGAKLLPDVAGRRLATARSTAKAGGTGKLRLKLSRAARRELAKKRKLRVAFVVEVRQRDGSIERTRQVVTIKAPKKPKKRKG